MPARDPALAAFGERVRRRRSELGISQERMAALVGIDRAYMGGIERGERNVGLLYVLRLVEGLQTTAAALLDGLGDGLDSR